MRIEIRASSNFNPRFSHGGVKAKVTQGLRKTIRELKGDVGRKLRERYTIAAGKVTRQITVRAWGTYAEMRAPSKRFDLKEFRHRPRRRLKRQPPAGIFAEVVRGQGGYLKQAWTKYAGGIFERITKKRSPFKKLKGPSPAGMLSSMPMSSFIEQRLQRRIEKNFKGLLEAVIL